MALLVPYAIPEPCKQTTPLLRGQFDRAGETYFKHFLICFLMHHRQVKHDSAGS